MKKERQQEESKEKYLWLDPNDERKYMTDRGILEKYIDSDKSCLTDKEKKEVMDMLYKYKDAFSLRDKICICPNIKVELDAMDKSLFSTFPCKRRRQNIDRQGNEALMLFRYIKRMLFSLL